MSAVSVHRRSRPAILPHDSVANHANGSYARDLNIYQPRGWAELGSLRVRDSGRGTYPECGRRTFHRWAFARAARSRRYRSMRTHCSRATWSWRSRARISSWSRSTFSSSSPADMFSRRSCGECRALASTATKAARTTEPQLVFTALAPLLALGPEPPAVPVPLKRSRRDLEATLRARIGDLSALLGRNVAEARPVLEALLDGKLIVTPTPIDAPRSGVRGAGLPCRGPLPMRATYTVRIPLNLAGVLEQEHCSLWVASPPGTGECWTVRL